MYVCTDLKIKVTAVRLFYAYVIIFVHCLCAQMKGGQYSTVLCSIKIFQFI